MRPFHYALFGAPLAAMALSAPAPARAAPPPSPLAVVRATEPHPRQLTDHDYARAVEFLAKNVDPLVDDHVTRVHWIDDGHFWYMEHGARGNQYKIMDVVTGRVEPAFNQTRLAVLLSKASGREIEGGDLGITAFKHFAGGRLDVTLKGKTRGSDGERYVCHLHGVSRCQTWVSTLKYKPGLQVGRAVVSPNGQYAVFVRNWNLWLRNLKSGKETPLTRDGTKYYGYATGNDGWEHDRGAIVRWSPDSKKVVTYRQDARKVAMQYTLQTGLGHSTLHSWKYPFSGDKQVFMIQPVIIDVKKHSVLRLKMQPEQRLSTECDRLACDFAKPNTWSDAKWGPRSKMVALITTSRDRKHEWFRVANAETGEVRSVFHYTAKNAWYESGSGIRGMANWLYLPETGDAIWPTEQNNWLNLYVYSLKTGKEVRPLTTGSGDIDKEVFFNRQKHVLWFTANDRNPGVNPYFRQLFKVNIATGKTTLLTPEKADHTIWMSPDGRYFVDSYSTPTQAPVTVLRLSKSGKIVATIAKTDISRLTAMGWKPPKVIKVKAHDGKTTLYGLMFKPTNFDPHKRYPIIDYVYPGPQIGSIFTFSWKAARIDHQAMAELGFIVVAINGMGTPFRSASFHKYWYGDMGANTIPDQVAGIRELAKRYPWINAERVGIWGHSGGGVATAQAILSDPNLFKVAWAESGDYEQRNYENDWGEEHQGLLIKYKNGTTNYRNQATELKAKNLKGHLMLVDGAIDNNVPVSNTMLLVNSLIRANKNFSMLMLPDELHPYGNDTDYVMRRRWDYFVKYLAGNIPPNGYMIPQH